MRSLEIRHGVEGDLPSLVEIINHYIETTHVTFDVEPFSVESRRPWFAQFDRDGIHRILVAEAAGRVEGYATSTVHRAKPAYGRSVETTIYLNPDAVGQRIGSRLYGALLVGLREEALVHRGFAGVALPNAPSVAFHQRMGFHPLGIFHEIGHKFGKYWDVQWFECDLSGRGE